MLLIRQYRHPVGRLLWEIPAGLRDVAGEPLRDTAAARAARRDRLPGRRLAGAGRLLPSPGISTERLRVFLARGLTEVPEAERTTCRSTRRRTCSWPGCRWTRWSGRVLAGRPAQRGHRGRYLVRVCGPAGRVRRAARRGGARELTGAGGMRPEWNLPATGPGGGHGDRGRTGCHEGRRPPGSQEPRVPGGHHPGRGARAGPGRARGLRREGRRASAPRSPTRTSSPRARRSCPTADDVWQTGDLILKVKEPVAEEYHRMRKGQVLFTYLHLAASRECTDALLDRRHHRASPTRPCSCPTGRCRCWPRCPRWPAGWRPRSARTTCSATAAAAAC